MLSHKINFWTKIFVFLHACLYVLGLRAINDKVKSTRKLNNEDISQYDIPQMRVEDIKDTDLVRVPDSEENLENSQEVPHDIEMILEEKYKFVNDETSRRFKITSEAKESSEFSERKDDQQVAWAFRAYAARRIVGGMETSISMYPYNVAISRSGKHWCGGGVIDEQWILTAGHCFESAHDGNKKKLTPFIIRAGSSFHGRGGYQARVNKVFFPPKYVPGSADYDYSLLRLDRPMPIGRNIAVLNLPSKEFTMKEEDILIVTGWGSTADTGVGHIPERLRFVPVPLMVKNDCQKSYRFHITARMLCAGYATGGKDACNHDSGGPAVRDGVLLGVVSFGGKKCGDPRSPGVYSKVAEVTEWVEETISDNEAWTVPELKGKIQKARLRERELQKFKTRVESKKSKIKNWLKDVLRSPSFLQFAKKKLKQIGVSIRRRYRRADLNMTLEDDRTMDEINLSNQINEQILETGRSDDVADKFINTLALREVMRTRSSGEHLDIVPISDEIFGKEENNDEASSIDTLIAYITEET